MKQKETVVIGCGIIGLTTALTLQQHNIPVKIVTAQLPAETTSAIAAAVWLPYEVKPYDKVKHWSKLSYNKYQALSLEKKSGIKMIQMTSILEKEEDAWWKDALPTGKIRKAKKEELPGNNQIGYVLEVPMIETHLHLQFLLDKFEANGGTVEIKHINALDIFEGELVVNCTGLAAKNLTDDKQLYPIQGQIVYLEADPKMNCIVSEIAEGPNKDKLAYIIPRSDHIVLGGTATPKKWDTYPSEDEANAIIRRCASLNSTLSTKSMKYSVVGLRPGRSEIRLARESNIIHNYGHGGGGYTVAWGCAAAVYELISSTA